MRALGIDVTSTPGEGRRGRSDVDQLAFATGEGRVLITRNVRDYAVLHQQMVEAGRSHHGIVVITRQRFSPGEYAAALHTICTRLTSDEIMSRMLFLADWLHAPRVRSASPETA